MYIIIISRSLIAKKIITLDAIKVTKMKLLEVRELFRRYAKLTKKGLDITREVDKIVRELKYLTLAITLTDSYISITSRLSSDIERYLLEYRQRRKELL